MVWPSISMSALPLAQLRAMHTPCAICAALSIVPPMLFTRGDARFALEAHEFRQRHRGQDAEDDDDDDQFHHGETGLNSVSHDSSPL